MKKLKVDRFWRKHFMYYPITVKPYVRAEHDAIHPFPADVIMLVRLFQAFKAPVSIGGLDLSERKADYDTALELAKFFRFFMIPASGGRAGMAEFHVREDGGTRFLSSAAFETLKECWFIKEKNQRKTGYRQHMGIGDIEDVLAVEDTLGTIIGVSTEERKRRETETADPPPDQKET